MLPTRPEHHSPPNQPSLQSTRAPFLVRKLGNLKSKFCRRDRQKEGLLLMPSDDEPYRQTRSMDMSRKQFMSQPVLTLPTQLGNTQPSSGHSSFESQHQTKNTRRKSANDDLLRTAQLHLSPILTTSTFPETRAIPTFTVSDDDPPSAAQVESMPNQRIFPAPKASAMVSEPEQFTPGLPPQPPAKSVPFSLRPGWSPYTPSEPPQLPPKMTPDLFQVDSGNAGLNRSATIGPSVMDKTPSTRSNPLRLGSLPPMVTSFEGSQVRVRMSPVVMRQKPLPIANLPMMPTPITPPTESPSRNQGQLSRLKSMPRLPMEGQDTARMNDPDHEQTVLESEDEEAEGEGEDDEGDYRDAMDRQGAATPATDEDLMESEEPMGDSMNTLVGLADVHIPSPDLFPRNSMERNLLTPQASSSTNIVLNPPSRSSSIRIPNGLPARTENLQDSTPVYRRSLDEEDYFVVERPTEVPHLQVQIASPSTPRAGAFLRLGSPDGKTPLASGPSQITSAFHSGVASTSTFPPNRPGLYRQPSKSMVNLLTSVDSVVKPILGVVSHTLGGVDIKSNLKGKAPEMASVPEVVDYETSEVLGGETLSAPKDEQQPPQRTMSLRRQRSLPTFKSSGPPPPYPSFLPRYVPPSKEEEGKECLPQYTNDIYLVAIMPLKLEFTGPGVQAKDRKWRRVLCVLDGTAFRVYSCSPNVSGVSAIGNWWERKVGVGDVSLSGGRFGTGVAGTSARDPISARRERELERTIVKLEEESRIHGDLQLGISVPMPCDMEQSYGEDSGSNSSPQSTTGPRSRRSLFLHPRSAAPSISSSRSTTPSILNSPTTPTRSSFQFSRPGTAMSNSAPTMMGSGQHRLSHFRRQMGGRKPLQEPGKKDLLRVYSLQHAESGVATDYLKRKNVIRVRLEGEQFMLQATDVSAVIEWIEGLQAAANIALDLDERAMPKGPIFPRRRRRRRAPPDAEAVPVSTEPSQS